MFFLFNLASLCAKHSRRVATVWIKPEDYSGTVHSEFRHLCLSIYSRAAVKPVLRWRLHHANGKELSAHKNNNTVFP